MPIKTALLNMRKLFTHAPFESILLSMMKGSDHGAPSAKLIPPPEMYEIGSTRRVRRDGITYELDPSCMAQWWVFWGLQDATREKLYSLVKPGDVVLDVGTNIGETLLHFARLVGRNGRVYGFEPDEKNFANVQRNISLNDFRNVEVFKLGVSDTRASQRLYRVDAHNLGMNRILNDDEAVSFEDFTVIQTDTIDNVVSKKGLAKVDLIKIDIEGFEMHALRGAKNVLQEFRPALFIETGYSRLLKLGTSPAEMMDYLARFGYKIFLATTDEEITAQYDFSLLGDNTADVYALSRK
jgi:FkbM family methyltransferase